MSTTTITFKYDDEEKQVSKFANFEECKKAFQKEFELTDEEMENIALYYYDEDGDQTMMSSNEDYNMFLETNCTSIEGQKNNFEKPDPMRSATVFKKNVEEPIKEANSKNLVDSFLDNSVSLENSANIGIYLGKKNTSDNIEIKNKYNEVN